MARSRLLLLFLSLALGLAWEAPGFAAPAPVVQTATRSFKQRVVRGLKRTTAAVALTLAAHAATIPLTEVANHFVESSPSTIVFSAGHDVSMSDRTASAITDYFMYAPVTLRQVLRGHRVEWVSRATVNEVLTKVQEAQYQNVVFVGHGSQDNYWAYDGSVSSYALSSVLTAKKSGETVQYTCGAPGGLRIADVALKDPSRGLHSDREVTVLENFLGAWKLTVSNTPIAKLP